MAYMNSRSAEAMGDAASDIAASKCDPKTQFWDGTQCQPFPASAYPGSSSSGTLFGMSTTTVAIVAGVGLAAYLLMKKRR